MRSVLLTFLWLCGSILGLSSRIYQGFLGIGPIGSEIIGTTPKVEIGIDKTGDKQTRDEGDWEEIPIQRTAMYVICGVGVRNAPLRSSRILEELPEGTRVYVTAKIMYADGKNIRFYRIESDKYPSAYIASGRLISRSPFSHGIDARLKYERVADRLTKYYVEEQGEDGLTDRGTVGYSIDVIPIMQYPELPEGCEITALTAELNFFGFALNKLDMADNYLPKSDNLRADPNEYYLLDPRSNGYYCFAPVLVKTVNNYNLAHGTDIYAEDLTGCEVTDLYKQISKGIPVVVWGTVDMDDPVIDRSGLYDNLHCFLLSGYTNNTVTLTDSINGIITVRRAQFERIWKMTGSRAMIAY